MLFCPLQWLALQLVYNLPGVACRVFNFRLPAGIAIYSRAASDQVQAFVVAD